MGRKQATAENDRWKVGEKLWRGRIGCVALVSFGMAGWLLVAQQHHHPTNANKQTHQPVQSVIAHQFCRIVRNWLWLVAGWVVCVFDEEEEIGRLYFASKMPAIQPSPVGCLQLAETACNISKAMSSFKWTRKEVEMKEKEGTEDGKEATAEKWHQYMHIRRT